MASKPLAVPLNILEMTDTQLDDACFEYIEDVEVRNIKYALNDVARGLADWTNDDETAAQMAYHTFKMACIRQGMCCKEQARRKLKELL